MSAWIRFKSYVLRNIVTQDTSLGVLFGGNIGETISARADTARVHGRLWGCYLCKVLGWIQKNHCPNALANARLIAQRILDDIDLKIERKYMESHQHLRR